ncbi:MULTISPECIES: GNAT family N-acetyltransferase [unclassified Methylophilus]|uniref:GNAT family N-acetyltransferase n=1 Tax=unclassified Methylophilus TaxID=2630143 RepID=UPI0006F88638|nr:MULTISPECIES: GNAT family N-acetyltransferase [unclassified Methylophilus]KQT42494.1 hypothetical protein ASG34_07050 [Methylophilus sp. Leaf416]KQT56677.1 hypothetical protein ASG44_07025 [Methylophilus sp. Leaf459]
MTNPIEISPALATDASAIAELIYSTSLICCFTPEQPCPEWFKESVASHQIANQLQAEQMVWLVAKVGQMLVGVLTIRDRSHVKYFFVHPNHQMGGVGKQLWHSASRNGLLGNSLTVRSSLFAVPVYERLGFKIIDPPEAFNGMHYQTMVASYG